jgi:hypothetical protein
VRSPGMRAMPALRQALCRSVKTAANIQHRTLGKGFRSSIPKSRE